jgi:hypothetical protein
MESWESCRAFWYWTQGKNPTRTAPESSFPSALQSVQNCSFQQTRRRADSHRTWTVDRTRASKDPLESWGCLLPFWYSTPRQISDQTAPDFNLLAAACSQVWIDIVIWSSLFAGDIARLSVAIHYGASKSDAPTHNLISTIESLLWWFLDMITLTSKNLNQNALRRISVPFECWDLLAQKFGWFTTWSSRLKLCCHRMLSLASSRLSFLEFYLEPHPLDLPCASHALLAIM